MTERKTITTQELLYIAKTNPGVNTDLLDYTVDSDLLDVINVHASFAQSMIHHAQAVVSNALSVAMAKIPADEDRPDTLPLERFYLVRDEEGDVVKDVRLDGDDLIELEAYTVVFNINEQPYPEDMDERFPMDLIGDITDYGLMLREDPMNKGITIERVTKSVYNNDGEVVGTYLDPVRMAVFHGTTGGMLIRDEEFDTSIDPKKLRAEPEEDLTELDDEMTQAHAELDEVMDGDIEDPATEIATATMKLQ